MSHSEWWVVADDSDVSGAVLCFTAPGAVGIGAIQYIVTYK